MDYNNEYVMDTINWISRLMAWPIFMIIKELDRRVALRAKKHAVLAEETASVTSTIWASIAGVTFLVLAVLSFDFPEFPKTLQIGLSIASVLIYLSLGVALYFFEQKPDSKWQYRGTW